MANNSNIYGYDWTNNKSTAIKVNEFGILIADSTIISSDGTEMNIDANTGNVGTFIEGYNTLTPNPIVDTPKRALVDNTGALKVSVNGGGGISSVIQGIDVTTGNATNLNSKNDYDSAEKLYTISRLQGLNGTTVKDIVCDGSGVLNTNASIVGVDISTIGSNNALDVSNLNYVLGRNGTSTAPIDVRVNGSSNEMRVYDLDANTTLTSLNNKIHSGTVSTNAIQVEVENSSLTITGNVNSSLYTGATALTSTLNGSKQSLDVNVTNASNINVSGTVTSKTQDGAGNNITSDSFSFNGGTKVGLDTVVINNVSNPVNESIVASGNIVTGATPATGVNTIDTSSSLYAKDAANSRVLLTSTLLNTTKQSLDVNVANTAAIPVSGSFYPPTQPISGEVTVDGKTTGGTAVAIQVDGTGIVQTNVTNTSIDTHLYANVSGSAYQPLHMDGNGSLHTVLVDGNGHTQNVTNTGNAQVSIFDGNNGVTATQITGSSYAMNVNVQNPSSQPVLARAYNYDGTGSNAITSTANGAKQGLDVNVINSGGIASTVISKTYDGSGTYPITSDVLLFNGSNKTGLDVAVINTSATPIPTNVQNTVSVAGTFWQTTQPVSVASAINVKTQDGSGTAITSDTFTFNGSSKTGLDVAVINNSTNPVQTNITNTNVPVTGTFWQATQPVSFATPLVKIQDTAGNTLSATNTTSGSLKTTSCNSSGTALGTNSFSFNGATKEGLDVVVINDTTNAVNVNVTNTVPISGTVTDYIKDSNGYNLVATSSTSGSLKTTPCDTNGNAIGTNSTVFNGVTKTGLDTVVINDTTNPVNTNITNASLAVTGSFYLATQPVSGTVTSNIKDSSGNTITSLTSPSNLVGALKTQAYGTLNNSAISDTTVGYGNVGSTTTKIGQDSFVCNSISKPVVCGGTDGTNILALKTDSVGSLNVNAVCSGTVGLSTSANTVKIDSSNNNVKLINSAGTYNANILPTVTNLNTSSGLVTDSALYALNIGTGDVQPLTVTLNGSRNQLEVRDNDAVTSLTSIDTKTPQGYNTTNNNSTIGLNMYQIMPKTKSFAVSGISSGATANICMAGINSSISINAFKFGLSNTNGYWYYCTGTLRNISYTYIDSSGNEQTGTTSLGSLPSAYQSLGTFAGFNQFNVIGNVQIGSSDDMRIAIGSTLPATNSTNIVASLTNTNYQQQGCFFTCPNNAIAMITSVDAILLTTNDYYNLNLCDSAGNRSIIGVYYMYASGVNNYRAAGGGDYGCIGRIIKAGETVYWTNQLTTSANRNVYCNIRVLYF